MAPGLVALAMAGNPSAAFRSRLAFNRSSDKECESQHQLSITWLSLWYLTSEILLKVAKILLRKKRKLFIYFNGLYSVIPD